MTDKEIGGFESVGSASEKELRWSQWWLDHKERVRKIALGLFIAVDAVLLCIGMWGFIDWLAIGGLREEQAIRQMTSPEYGRVQHMALQEIQVGAPIVLPGGTGKIDILTPVENSNRTFWVEIDYRYLVGGEPQSLHRAFVLPNQAKYLSELAAPSGSGSVELKIERRVWHRANLQGEADAEAFAASRLNVYPANPVYVPSDPLATSPVSSAKFTLVNDAAFGFYDVDMLVLLYRGDSIVGVNRARIDTLAAGARKPMELFWYQILPQVTKVDVIPEINIYDPDVYRAPQ